MALPPLADIQALADSLGLPEAQVGADLRAHAVLRSASAFVRHEVRKTWVDAAGELFNVPDVIPELVVEIAAAAYRNPDGLSAETLGNYSYTRPGGNSAILTASQRALIGRLRAKPPLWSLPTTRGCEDLTLFLSDQYGGDGILDCGGTTVEYGP